MSFPEPGKRVLRHPSRSGAPESCGRVLPQSTPPSFQPGKTRLALLGLLLTLAAAAAHAILPPWLQHIVSATPAEQSLYRLMHLPAVEALYPRPPREAQAELSRAIASAPTQAELYALRARTEEQALDPVAAEADWKLYVTHAADPASAKVELAAFYRRRAQTPQLIQTLLEIAAAPTPAREQYANPTTQRSWRAFEQLLALSAEAALPPSQTEAIYKSFLDRYPGQPAVYARAFQQMVDQHAYPQAQHVIVEYQQHFPQDQVFPLRAQALLEAARGTPAQALAVYDRAFQPANPWFLHSPALLRSYFALLDQQHQRRAFVAQARAQLAAHPDGPEALNALARIFFYDQQAGRLPQAQQTLDQFRVAREARAGIWTPSDLATLAYLATSIHAYPEAARYNFALAASSGNLPSGEPAAQAGLAGLIETLLTASLSVQDQPLALGAGNLSLYRDIATLDQGPGYWNGILSLWLNGTDPDIEYETETAKAQTYFHRSKADELLAELDRRFPQAPERPALHAALLQAQTAYGEPAAVVAEATQFLAAFPGAPASYQVANSLADAYQQQQDTHAEFALYDTLLASLAARSRGYPLTTAAASTASFGGTPGVSADPTAETDANPNAEPGSEPDAQPGSDPGSYPDAESDSASDTPASRRTNAPAATLIALYPPTRTIYPAATQYARILDRYLSRLTALGQLPAALSLLRRELDRSPDDPLLYERLATFLEQNNLSAQQEAVFQQAIARFGSTSTYDRLARLYLREKKRQAFATLTRQVVDIFSGTDLDSFFAAHLADIAIGNASSDADSSSQAPGPQLALQLNLYAAKRFPHDLAFTRNLLTAYQTKPTANPAAYEALLRRQWWVADDLRDQFLAFLSRSGKLQAELAGLERMTGASKSKTPGTPVADNSAGVPALNQPDPSTDPAALDELASLHLWLSHYEQAAPVLNALTPLYPADLTLNNRAVSLFRSLSYLDSTTVALTHAVALETNLLRADPANPTTLANLGDLYAETTATGGEDLPAAAPYWRQIATLRPGTPTGYLTAATIFWDYFQYDDALALIAQARTRFQSPALYAFEAGAIQENRGNLPAAIAEYVAATTQPPVRALFQDSAAAAVEALLKPPSDAADSNLQATVQSLFNAPAAQDRLLVLATRQATAALVDTATAQAVSGSAEPAIAALTLRAEVLRAQQHSAQLAPMLQAALARTTTADEAAAIGSLARGETLNPPAALDEVEVTLNADALPVQTTQHFAPSKPLAASRAEPHAAAPHALDEVYEAALSREAVLTPDPVRRLELHFELATALEDRKQIPAATAVIDATLAANPRLLGVIRQAVDFYLRTKQPARAIATLLTAAGVAIPALAHDFTLEAANRANDANNPVQARTLAQQLLVQTPYDPRLLTVVATSYARQNDAAGLKAFYLARLDLAQKDAALNRESRKQDIALLRRGLIPALTRLQDYQAGEAQYIALLSAYPEDAGTASEAALYALAHPGRAPASNGISCQQQLVAFLHTTVQASPQDSRFAVLLALVDTTFEDLPGALAAYDAAIAIRKDRADLYQARAAIELLLAPNDPRNLDRAAADYQRLYLLTYHDPQWQTALAALRARQGRPDDAIAALVLAYPATGAQAADNSFHIAAQLAQWNLLPQALHFAQQGSTLAGATLLSKNAAGVQTHVAILARLQQPAQALALLHAAYAAALTVPLPALVAEEQKDDQDAREASSADDTADPGQMTQASRKAQAGQALTDALRTLGATAQTYSTPEQLATLGLLLDTLHGTRPAEAITVATAASLSGREALWRQQALLAAAPGQDVSAGLQTYIALQQHRLAFAELARTLEAYAARLRPEDRTPVRTQAAQAWRDACNAANELRLTRTLTAEPALRDRFFSLLLARDPAALAALAAGKDESLADAAVTYTLANANYPQTVQTLRARGRALPPVWATAALALTGLYDDQQAAPETASAFNTLLRADDTVATHLATRVDLTHTLAGDRWFPFASRYGLFLLGASAANSTADPAAKPAAEDFLPAALELDPAFPGAYLELARSYAEAGQFPAARAEFAHVFELSDTGRAAGEPAAQVTLEAHREEAAVLLREGNQPAALAEGRVALALLAQLAAKKTTPEYFFTEFAAIQSTLVAKGGPTDKVAAPRLNLRPETEATLHVYLLHSGSYRSNELLEAAYTAAPDSTLIPAAAAGTREEDQILGDLEKVPWLAAPARTALLLARLNRAQHPSAADSRSGQSDESASDADFGQVLSLQIKILQAYLAQGEFPRAQTMLDAISAAGTPSFDLQVARLELAARTGHLEALLAGYTDAPELAPSDAALRAAANHLAYPAGLATDASRPEGSSPGVNSTLRSEVDAARRLREYLFTRKQLAHTLAPADFLALAQSRLDTADLPGALELLRRLMLQPATAPGPSAGTESNDPGDSSLQTAGLGTSMYPTDAQTNDQTRSDPAADSSLTPPAGADLNTNAAARLLESTHHPAEALLFLRALATAAPWNQSYRLRLGLAENLAGNQAVNASSSADATALLTALAQDATAPYATRVQAAQTVPHALQTNSRELDLLARGTFPLVEARQPGFLAARLALAARAQTNPLQAATLYREALALRPFGPGADRTRLDLLLLLPAQAADAPALVRLAQTPSPSSPQPEDRDGDRAEGNAAAYDDAAPDTGSADDSVSPAALPPLARAFDLSTQVRLALKLADIAQADHDPAAAVGALRLALALAPEAAVRERLALLEAQVALAARNRARQPVLKKEIPDPSNVRPRLMALGSNPNALEARP